jgi:hypothetical protein
VIKARVQDYNNSDPFEVSVGLSGGPSPARSDTTDASGWVTFAGLTPNPTSGPQAYYDLNVTPPSGYVTIVDAVPPGSAAHVQLSPSQTWQTALGVYKPATMYVQLKNTDGAPFTGSTTVTVSYTRNSTQYSQQFAYTGTPLTIASINEGSTAVPLTKQDYTVSVSGGGVTATPVTQTVPDDYPNTLTHTFDVTVTVVPATVNVTVTRPSWWSCVAASSATVTLTGGPESVSLQGTTNSSGVATFNNVPIGSGYTISASWSSYNDSLPNQTVVAGTNNFPIGLGSC